MPGADQKANSTAVFGTVSAKGAYTQSATVGVPAGFVPTGMLTATSPASYQDAFIASFYPPGTRTNVSATEGFLWSVDPYGGGSDDEVAAFHYLLIGAAWDRE